jgi:hypothetical protein
LVKKVEAWGFSGFQVENGQKCRQNWGKQVEKALEWGKKVELRLFSGFRSKMVENGRKLVKNRSRLGDFWGSGTENSPIKKLRKTGRKGV